MECRQHRLGVALELLRLEPEARRRAGVAAVEAGPGDLGQVPLGELGGDDDEAPGRDAGVEGGVVEPEAAGTVAEEDDWERTTGGAAGQPGERREGDTGVVLGRHQSLQVRRVRLALVVARLRLASLGTPLRRIEDRDRPVRELEGGEPDRIRTRAGVRGPPRATTGRRAGGHGRERHRRDGYQDQEAQGPSGSHEALSVRGSVSYTHL